MEEFSGRRRIHDFSTKLLTHLAKAKDKKFESSGTVITIYSQNLLSACSVPCQVLYINKYIYPQNNPIKSIHYFYSHFSERKTGEVVLPRTKSLYKAELGSEHR